MRRALIFSLLFLSAAPAFAEEGQLRTLRHNHKLLLQAETDLRAMEQDSAGAEELASQRSLVSFLRQRSSEQLSKLSPEDAAREFLDHTLDRSQRERIESAEARRDAEFLELGYLCVSAGRFEDAERAFYEAIRLDPANHARILRHYEQAVLDDPGQEKAFLELGYVYYMAEQNSRAEGAFREALRLNPSSEQARHGLRLLSQI